MIKRIIKNIESISIGKTTGHNDDSIYIGENFAAVIDGVSQKSTVNVKGKEIKVAKIITEALSKIDRKDAPRYAKTLTFDEFVRYINMYIRKYCEHIGISVFDYQLEATGVIYSKYYNQIWLVGDCIAIYDGNIVSNELKIDKVYIGLRIGIIEELIKLGYTKASLIENDIAKEIIKKPESISKYVTDKKVEDRIRAYIKSTMWRTLIECGFSEQEIEEQELLQKYYNPIELQKDLKNNSQCRQYGYSVFNGISTPIQNCKVEDLPTDVKYIKLASDGFSAQVLRKSKDLGQAIRKTRKLAKIDPLSIDENRTVRAAVRQNRRENILAIDDASAVIIGIESKRERDDER